MNAGPAHGPRWAALIGALERINDLVGRTVAWLALAMVAVTFLVVVLRYLFDLGWIALQESVTYMHALLFMLGIGYALRHDGHVRVDIFYQRLSPRGRAWVDLLGTLLLLFPVCLFIAWMAWDYVAASWAVAEASREAGGLPGVYLLKALILVMPALVMVQGLATALRNALFLAGIAVPDADADADASERERGAG
ncbi:TRAP transporter small permease subunit [Thiococcus pfennigii]|uniref:TRAP transporter small permease subunit n=1 Tax=Thiococcus pfennigii TaxID=1057 RepID=UPI001903C037|nr:TRAP transporter small permease subunit [Thiococcus pfennigii]MBK1701653.1 C4-dicarboxylate ABC transporter permease [Thiococcus pfennigii]MBK1730498.1 C4-dicarboxylate ABC transporter permease [Thiococcus pfennigii]